MDSAQKGIDLIEVAKDYVHSMLRETQGRKALILDQETLNIVSLVYSRTHILEQEVFLISKLDELPQEKLTHLKAVFFCRASDRNI
jgi:vacuolar protein sorting-associated protein 45